MDATIESPGPAAEVMISWHVAGDPELEAVEMVWMGRDGHFLEDLKQAVRARAKVDGTVKVRITWQPDQSRTAVDPGSFDARREYLTDPVFHAKVELLRDAGLPFERPESPDDLVCPRCGTTITNPGEGEFFPTRAQLDS